MKIFCIGFNKTGTVSLHAALTYLGYSGIHGMWGNHLKFVDAKNNNKKLLSGFSDNIIHFSDLDIMKDNFKSLDEQYPNSKFILNTRKKEDWLISRKKHYDKYTDNGKYKYDWRWIKDTPEQWGIEWDLHHKDVIDYFKDRPKDLLIMDIPGGDGWDKLCPFLGIEIVQSSFPKKNVTNK